MNSFSRRISAGPLWMRIAYKKTGHPVGDGLFNFVLGISGRRDVCLYRHAGMRLFGITSLDYREKAQ